MRTWLTKGPLRVVAPSRHAQRKFNFTDDFAVRVFGS